MPRTPTKPTKTSLMKLKKSALITKVLQVAGLTGSARNQGRSQMNDLTKNQIVNLYFKAWSAKHQGASQKKSTSTKRKSSAKRKSSGRKRSSRKIPVSIRKRGQSIARAIAAGHIAAKQGKRKPADMSGDNATERYKRFNALYKGAVAKGRKSGKARPTVKAIRQTVPQSQRKGVPSQGNYYLSKGYISRVGGGPGGPGIVRVIPKSGATPFRQLSSAEQQKVVSFLNGAGKVLRGKGAKRQAAKQLIKGAANRGW